MPQTIEFNGETHQFPDDFTDADIAKALGGNGSPARPDFSQNPPPVSVTMDTRPKGLQSVASTGPSAGAMGMSLASGLPQNPTSAGEVLKILGKSSAGTAAMMAPVFTGGASIPVQAAVNAASGGVQSAMMGGDTKEIATSAGLGGLLGIGSGMIPRAAPAIATLKKLAGIAPDSSVPLRNSIDPLVDILKEAASGGQKPKVVTDLLKRVNQGGPLTYEEARRFYSNTSRISADEAGRLTDNMRRLLGDLRAAMHQDISANRAAYGVGNEYSQAVNQYHAAKTFENVATKTGKVVGASAGATALGGLGWKIANALSDSHRR